MTDNKLPQTTQSASVTKVLERSKAQLSVTQNLLQKAKVGREVRQQEDDSWIDRLYAWADDSNIPEKVLPRSKDGLRLIKKLSFWGCNLTSLSHDIYKLKKLEVLDLGNNKLTEIPAGIEALQKLKSLSFAENNLRNLPDEIIKLNNLLSFMIRGNTSLELNVKQKFWLEEIKNQGCYIF